MLWTGFIALKTSLNFTVDLERIDRVEARPLLEAGEWYLALATATTFVWLYISVLRLITWVWGLASRLPGPRSRRPALLEAPGAASDSHEP